MVFVICGSMTEIIMVLEGTIIVWVVSNIIIEYFGNIRVVCGIRVR